MSPYLRMASEPTYVYWKSISNYSNLQELIGYIYCSATMVTLRITIFFCGHPYKNILLIEYMNN